MAKYKFQPGDLVQLKSGGPVMTVQHHVEGANNLYCRCEWFAGDVVLAHSFAYTSLVKARKLPISDTEEL